MSALASIHSIIKEIQQGKPVVLIDDKERENEGDLVIAAEKITPEAINFMIKEARGLVCLALTPEIADRLDLPPMVVKNETVRETPFTVSIEARYGVDTGISAFDRAVTIQTAVKDGAQPEDLVRPGHVFPLRAKKEGVLVRAGHTEASIDLARLAGLKPAGVICEIIKADGKMARYEDLIPFCEQFSFKMGSVAELILYRFQTEELLETLVRRPIVTPWGKFTQVIFRDVFSSDIHSALIKGENLAMGKIPTYLFQGMNYLDFLGGNEEVQSPLQRSFSEVAQEKKAILLFLSPEEGKSPLSHDSNVFLNNQETSERVKASGIAAQILMQLGVKKLTIRSEARLYPKLSQFPLELSFTG